MIGLRKNLCKKNRKILPIKFRAWVCFPAVARIPKAGLPSSSHPKLKWCKFKPKPDPNFQDCWQKSPRHFWKPALMEPIHFLLSQPILGGGNLCFLRSIFEPNPFLGEQPKFLGNGCEIYTLPWICWFTTFLKIRNGGPLGVYSI